MKLECGVFISGEVGGVEGFFRQREVALLMRDFAAAALRDACV